MPKSQNPKKATQRSYKLSDRVTTPSIDLYQKFKVDKAVQFTSLFVRTYASIEEVERLLEVLNPDEYAYILHDKDVNPDGTPKEPHVHLLMYKKHHMRLTKLLTFSQQATRVEVPRSKKYAYEYLTHKNDPDKKAYDSNEIHEYHKGDNTFAVTQQEAREQRNLTMLDDIVNLSRRQMAEKYGSDYIKNYQRYEAFMQVVHYDEMEHDCALLAENARPYEEVYHLSEMSGDEIRLTLADYVCVRLRESMEQKMPTPNEVVALYYQCLQLYRDGKRKEAQALRWVEEVEEV